MPINNLLALSTNHLRENESLKKKNHNFTQKKKKKRPRLKELINPPPKNPPLDFNP